VFFLLFLFDDRRIREAQKHMDPTDPDPVPDPQHCFQLSYSFFYLCVAGRRLPSLADVRGVGGVAPYRRRSHDRGFLTIHLLRFFTSGSKLESC
jgi:hypothetical protein